MKKNVKCIAQTINLSQPRTCARPRQVQKLINADVTSPCPDSLRNPYRTPCRPVPVRICTRIDMQRTLPPKVCDCPQKPPPETVVKKLTRWVKNFAKSLIAGGFVYWTTAEGFWGDGREAEGLYHRIIATVTPAFDEVVEFDEINLPHIENLKHDLLDAYNRSVLRLVGLIAWAPIMLEEKMNHVFFPCDPNDDGQAPGVKKIKKGPK